MLPVYDSRGRFSEKRGFSVPDEAKGDKEKGSRTYVPFGVVPSPFLSGQAGRSGHPWGDPI